MHSKSKRREWKAKTGAVYIDEVDDAHLINIIALLMKTYPSFEGIKAREPDIFEELAKRVGPAPKTTTETSSQPRRRIILPDIPQEPNSNFTF